MLKETKVHERILNL